MAPGVKSFARAIGLAGVLAVLAAPALARTGDAAGFTGGFVSGFTHPIFGGP